MWVESVTLTVNVRFSWQVPTLKEKKIKSLLSDRGIKAKGKKDALVKKLIEVLKEEEKQVPS